MFCRNADLVLDAPGLGIEDTPHSVYLSLKNGDITRALSIAVQLDSSIVPQVLSFIPKNNISLVASAMAVAFVPRLLNVLADLISKDKPEFHLYLLWCKHIISAHFRVLSEQYSRFREPILSLQRALLKKNKSLCEWVSANDATMKFLLISPNEEEKDGNGVQAMDEEEDKEAEHVEEEKEAQFLEGWGTDEFAGVESTKKKRKKKTKKTKKV